MIKLKTNNYCKDCMFSMKLSATSQYCRQTGLRIHDFITKCDEFKPNKEIKMSKENKNDDNYTVTFTEDQLIFMHEKLRDADVIGEDEADQMEEILDMLDRAFMTDTPGQTR